MSSEHSTPLSPKQKCTTDPALLDAAIQEFLGIGLGYSDWPEEVRRRNHVWYPGLEKVIIKKEFEYFKDEIQFFRSEPAIAQPSRAKSNSLKSILKRLKGEPWMDGGENEWEERFFSRRLLSKDAKDRCLIDYVHRWDREAALLSSRVSSEAVSSKSNIDSIEFHSDMSVDCTTQFGTLSSTAADKSPHQESPRPEQEFNPLLAHDTNMNTGTVRSTHGDSEKSSSNTIHSTYSNPLWSPSEDFDLLPSSQHAVSFPVIEGSGRSLLSRNFSDAIQQMPTPSHDAAMASFDRFMIGEDGVPTGSAVHSHGFDLVEAEPNVLTWLESNPVSEENSEPTATESEAPLSDPAFRGAFFNLRDSIDMGDFLVTEGTSTFEAGVISENIPVKPAGHQKTSQGSEVLIVSESAPSPQSGSHARKRRRRNTFGMSPDTSECRNVAAAHSTYNVASDLDTKMVGYENSPPTANTPNYVGECMQSPPPSRPLPSIPYPRMLSNSAHMLDDQQTNLQQELRQARDELDSAAKQHQDELDFLSKKHQAEVLDLREQVHMLQVSNKRIVQQYEGLTRDLINEKIILQEASSRKKSISETLLTGPEEREQNAKTFHSFPSSRKPRPLSLSLRTVTAINAPPSIRSSSSTSSENPPTEQIALPIPSDRSNMLGSLESLALRPATMSHGTSAIRSYNAVSSEDRSAALTPPRPSGRSNRSGSADSLAAPNLSDTVRRDPNPKPHWMHKISSSFMRKQYRDDSDRHVQSVQPVPVLPLRADSVPTLPSLDRTVPLNIQMSDVLIDGDKRWTKDSGYDSLEFETCSRASMADGEE